MKPATASVCRMSAKCSTQKLFYCSENYLYLTHSGNISRTPGYSTNVFDMFPHIKTSQML